MSGGKRAGAGRPKLSGKYGEATKAIRVPLKDVEDIYACVQHDFYRMPFYEDLISAGFPSPADEKVERHLDLNQLLIKHPAATFFLRVSGSSMIGAGIQDGDIIIVDRSLDAVHGKIVIAAVNGELTVKRLMRKGNLLQLVAENEDYSPITITPEDILHIWGVVTSVVRVL